jgi:flagellar basal body P-ring formation chaperone FlgA
VLSVYRTSVAWALCVGLAAVTARAAPAAATETTVVSVDKARVSLEDVMPDCPEQACKMDLGPAPAPQSSWLVDASVIRNALESAGEDRQKYANLKAVRVVSAGRTLDVAEASELVRPSIERALPPGVTLGAVEAKSRLTLPLLGVAGAASLPKLPKRAGPFTTTAMVEILLEGVQVRRVPVLVRLTIGADAARPDVPRGHTLTLVIERSNVTVSTDGVALRDSAVGEIAPFKVQRTGRILNARIKSAGVAVVTEAD